MDRDQEEFRTFGFVGIYRESCKTIFRWKKIFTQITLALILPFSILCLAHSMVSEIFFGNILTNYNLDANIDTGERQATHSKSGGISLWVFKVIYFILVLFFSLASTAAVVYTIACIYTSKEVTFRKVMSGMSKLWKRLLCTFFWSFLIYSLFSFISILLFVIWQLFMGKSAVGIAYLVIWLVAFIVVSMYIIIICQLAYVVSVLDDEYGRKAIRKSKALIKGKMGAVVGCFVVFFVLFFGLEMVFELFVSFGRLVIGIRIVVGLASLVLFALLCLLQLVVQTVIYFVCKSYHQETIDRHSLARHLEGYTKIKDVQLQQVNNV